MARSFALPLTLAASLVVPALLASGWAWLRFGGRVDELRHEEQRAAVAALDDIDRNWRAALRRRLSAAADGVVLLAVDDQGRLRGPFAPWPEVAATAGAAAPLALELARYHAERGDGEAALAFYSHLGFDSLVEEHPLDVLRWARVLARRDPAAAMALLARARAAGTAPTTVVPFALLTRLAAAQLAAAAGDRAPAQQLQLRLATDPSRLPAEAVAPVLDEIGGWAGSPEPATVRALRAAAAWFIAVDGGALAPADIAEATAGCIAVRLDSGWAVTGARVARDELGRVTAAAAADHSELQFSRQPAVGEWARRQVAGLGLSLGVAPRGVPTSDRLDQLASLLLGLAVLAFVSGNLAMFVLVRRELALSRMKTDFVDLVSHELRTPLAALSLKTEMLASGAVPAERRAHYQRTLHREVERLGMLVTRVLDFARLARGRAGLRLQRVPVRELLAHALREARWALPLAGRVRVVVARDLPDVEVDQVALTQALRNLLENALKYAPEGTRVELAAACHGRTLTLAVADTGAGVPSAERAAIFTPFHRGSQAVGDGSGLGLAIAARAAAAHRGVLTLAVNQPAGSVFTLSLPVVPRGRSA